MGVGELDKCYHRQGVLRSRRSRMRLKCNIALLLNQLLNCLQSDVITLRGHLLCTLQVRSQCTLHSLPPGVGTIAGGSLTQCTRSSEQQCSQCRPLCARHGSKEKTLASHKSLQVPIPMHHPYGWHANGNCQQMHEPTTLALSDQPAPPSTACWII